MDAIPPTLEGTGEIVITPQDILFECPKCSKSMVADQAAEGQIVECPQCQVSVIVPAKSRVTAASPHESNANLHLPLPAGGDNAAVKQILSRIADADQRSPVNISDLMVAEQQVNALVAAELQRSQGQQAELAGNVHRLQHELGEALAKAQQAAQAEQRLNEMTRRAGELASQQVALKDQLIAGQQKLVDHQQQSAAREAAAQQRIAQADGEIQRLTTELAAMRAQLHDELAQRLRQADEFGKAQARQDALVGAREKRFDQLTQEMDRLRGQLARAVEQRAETERKSAASDEPALKRLEVELAEARAEVAQRVRQLDELGKAKALQEALVVAHEKKIAQLTQETDWLRGQLAETEKTSAASDKPAMTRLEIEVAEARAALRRLSLEKTDEQKPTANSRPSVTEPLGLTAGAIETAGSANLDQNNPKFASLRKQMQEEADRVRHQQADRIAKEFSHLRQEIVEKKADAEQGSVRRRWAQYLREFLK